MPNRYATIVGGKLISEDFGTITEGFDKVQVDVDALQAAEGGTSADLEAHKVDDTRHWTTEDRNKMEGIAEGAEVNQNAFAKVNGMDAANPIDEFTIAAGTGITVSINQITKTINITATGTSTPGAHASSHLEDGSDPIDLATDTTGGLMSAADKTKLNKLPLPPWTWADLEGGL